jgi:hypothetical protein
MMLLTFPLALLIAIASILGILVEDIYSKEVAEYAAQGVGQDVINLFIVVPILLIAAVMIKKESKVWHFVWIGSMIYTVYSYAVYCFGVHFNALFLLYIAIFGLSFYLLIGLIITINPEQIKSWFDEKTPIKMISMFLFIVAGLFYLIWLKDIVPALIDAEVPELVKEYNLPTNPIHVLDLALALPGIMISSFLFRKKQALGYVLAPAFVVFIIVMAIAIGGIVAVTIYKGYEGDLILTVVFGLIAAISCTIFITIVKHLKKGIEDNEKIEK